MHKFLYIFIAVLFLASCGHNKKYFKYDIEDVNIDSVPCTDIYGELLPINVSGTNSLFIADSLLLVDKQDGSSRYFFDVYNIITFDSITSFGLRGRAKNEFLDIPLISTKQYYYNENGDVIVPIIDSNLMKELNLSQSVKRNHTIIERMSPCHSDVEGSTVLIDNKPDNQFVYFYAHEDEFYRGKKKLPQVMVIIEQKNSKEIKCFGKLLNNNSDTKTEFFYWGKLVKQPNSDNLVLPLYLMNYLLFFNSSNMKCHAVHIQNRPSFEDKITSDKSITCFLSADATNDYIYVYYTGDYDIISEINPDYRGRILQFDWSGKLIKSYFLHDAVLTDISYSAMTNTLYGMNIYSGSLYSFKLGEEN